MPASAASRDPSCIKQTAVRSGGRKVPDVTMSGKANRARLCAGACKAAKTQVRSVYPKPRCSSVAVIRGKAGLASNKA
jgi:hypothetical protein